MKRTKLGAFIVILATFFLGALGGYSLSWIMSDAVAQKEHESPYGNVSDYVKERLNLDQEQVVKYDAFVEESHSKMSEIHSDYRKQFRTQVRNLQDEVRSILTEEQLAEYEKFLKEYAEFRRKERRQSK
jgi:hypothetical protein